jgi:hypothetical protein
MAFWAVNNLAQVNFCSFSSIVPMFCFTFVDFGSAGFQAAQEWSNHAKRCGLIMQPHLGYLLCLPLPLRQQQLRLLLSVGFVPSVPSTQIVFAKPVPAIVLQHSATSARFPNLFASICSFFVLILLAASLSSCHCRHAMPSSHQVGFSSS